MTSLVEYLRRAQVGDRLERTGERLFAVLGTDLDSVGENEFEPCHADKAEYSTQVGFQVFGAAAGVPAP